MDTLIPVIGIVLIVTGALALALNLVSRAVEGVAHLHRGESRVVGLGDLVVKLSERSIAPAVTFLLGVLLVDPVLFDYLWPGS